MFYYDIENPGHGLALHAIHSLGSTDYVGTWYTYDLNGNQLWFLMQGANIYKPSGKGFPLEGDYAVGEPVGRYHITNDEDGGGRILLSYDVKREAIGGTSHGFSPPPPEYVSGAIILTPLV